MTRVLGTMVWSLLLAPTAHAGLIQCGTTDSPSGSTVCKFPNASTDVCSWDHVNGELSCDLSTLSECNYDGNEIQATNYSGVYGEISIYGSCDNNGSPLEFCCLYEEDSANPLTKVTLRGSAYDDEAIGFHQHDGCVTAGAHNHSNGYNLKPTNMSGIKLIVYAGTGDDSVLGTNWALGLNEYLFGEYGDDDIRGYGGEDKLLGGFGNDTLYGGAGNDVLEAGLGSDYMYGEGGADVHCDPALPLGVCDQLEVDTALVLTHTIAGQVHNVADWVYKDLGNNCHTAGSGQYNPVLENSQANPVTGIYDTCADASYTFNPASCTTVTQTTMPQICVDASSP